MILILTPFLTRTSHERFAHDTTEEVVCFHRLGHSSKHRVVDSLLRPGLPHALCAWKVSGRDRDAQFPKFARQARPFHFGLPLLSVYLDVHAHAGRARFYVALR